MPTKTKLVLEQTQQGASDEVLVFPMVAAASPRRIGKESFIRCDVATMKKVFWYVLHNSLEIDTYMDAFKSEFPDNVMKEEFPRWFEPKIRKLYIEKDPSCTDELFALACGPSSTPISVNSCVVNDVKFVLEEILQFAYTSFKVVLFRVKWFDTRNEGRHVKRFVTRNNITQIMTATASYKDQPYILATQAKLVFYLEDPARQTANLWKVVQDVNHQWGQDEVMIEDDA
ncbi:hypothetical protein Tco_0652110 [Tanacetum coccineum]|uniref:DUF4216 domain-containing protein n=1 Tax=Tanacetum coccineum TaxID=301880 RepID=A0ABQ4WWN4_9ASTR